MLCFKSISYSASKFFGCCSVQLVGSLGTVMCCVILQNTVMGHYTMWQDTACTMVHQTSVDPTRHILLVLQARPTSTKIIFLCLL